MCLLSQINSYYRKHNADRIVQGDILKEVKFTDWDWNAKKNNIEIYKKNLPYIIILTQDCDLEQDFRYRTTIMKNNDKLLQSILVCPAYGWQDFIQGDHLKDFKLKMEIINSNQRNLIKNQQVPRYHYLEIDSENQLLH